MSFLMTCEENSSETKRELINLVYHTNKFYRKKFNDINLTPVDFSSKDSFDKLPFTWKHEILNDPYTLLTIPKHWLSEIGVSTGTSGDDRLYIPYSFNDLYFSSICNFFKSSLSIKDLIPIRSQDTVINILPYEVTQIGLTIHRLLQDGFGAGVIPAGKCGFYSRIDNIFEVMCNKKPQCMVTSPSYAVQLAEYALENNINLGEIPIRFIWLVGEFCSENLRKRISKLWSATVQVRYGLFECGAVGFQCAVGNDYHIADNHCFVEIVEDKVFGNGIGEIVITVFWRKSSPLLRFRTGDYGRLIEKPCECGAKTPLLKVFGRKEYILEANDKRVFLIDLENALLRYSQVGNWYQVKTGKSKIKIISEPRIGYKTPDYEKQKKIRIDLKDQFEMNFDLEFVAKTPRFTGKAVRLIRS